MRKFCLITILVLCFSSLSFAVAPTPGGDASIRDGLPISSPSIDRIPSVSRPYPTNKWFSSLIHAESAYGVAKPSLAMYTYPLVYVVSPKNDKPRKTTGNLVLGVPILDITTKCFAYSSNIYNMNSMSQDLHYNQFRDQLSILPYKNDNIVSVNINDVKLKSYSDWSCVIDNGYYEATIGKGFLFTYLNFKQESDAVLSCANVISSFNVYSCDDSNSNWTYTKQENSSFSGDKFVIEIKTKEYTEYSRVLPSTSIYYGVYLATATTNIESIDSSKMVKIKFKDNNYRYMSIVLMTSKEDLQKFYPYAYNFVKKTEANISIKNNVVETKFDFSFDNKKNVTETVSNETVFAVMPHHYKNGNATISYFDNGTRYYQTLRGKMKIAVGKSFTTRYKIQGILPFFKYDIDGNILNKIKEDYLSKDIQFIIKNMLIDNVNYQNTYRFGKAIANLSNLLPIADNIGSKNEKESIIARLKYDLKDWFQYEVGETSKYFAYDDKWGGLVGIKTGDFGTEKYNDHHFHYGYYIYASAILSMYDKTFMNSYKGMVELLIKDIANNDKQDIKFFPYMRNFDIYEGHSWANGMGGYEQADGGSWGNVVWSDSINEESSAEAMNAWSAIYLWGLATNNQKYINLGLELYTIHYNSLKEYYLDVDATKVDDSERIYPKEMMEGAYGNYGSVGILFGGRASYNVWWNTENTREIKGIQILPLTPAMSTYWLCDLDYTESFYNKMKEKESSTNIWNDVWSRLQALYSPSEALTTFLNGHNDNWESWTKYVDGKSNGEIDDGGSVTFTYHFINFFNKYGTPNFTYTADTSSYMVLEKDSTKYYCAYNPNSSYRNVHFYNSSGEDLGYLSVGAKSFSMSSKLIQGGKTEKISVYPVPYKPNSGGKFDAKGISFLGVSEGDNIKIFNIAGEKVFDETVLGTSNLFVWDGKNNAGNEVASGIYIYFIKTSSGQKFKGKLAIER